MLKRFFDLIVAFTALFVLMPVVAVIAATILVADGQPVLFRQKRLGKGMQSFEILKFRTMTNDPRQYEAKDTFTPDNHRVTRVGRVLRSSSLDELPTLFNVLKGDMSIVGPRPLLIHYKDLYYGDQARRHEVKPGITGKAQISGRNAVSWEERFRLDVDYVDTRSFLGDFKILMETVFVVLRRDGIGSGDNMTGAPFLGKPESKGGGT
jgi:undecaprenyl phosphate N,N'-diacetylbacillosamine 1-phosphate transferase